MKSARCLSTLFFYLRPETNFLLSLLLLFIVKGYNLILKLFIVIFYRHYIRTDQSISTSTLKVIDCLVHLNYNFLYSSGPLLVPMARVQAMLMVFAWKKLSRVQLGLYTS